MLFSGWKVFANMDLKHAAVLLVSHPERKTRSLHHRLYLSPAYIAPGELPYIKDGGCSWEILTRTPRMYQDRVLWAWLNFFVTLRGTSSKTTLSLLSYFLCLNTLTDSAKATAVNPVRMNTRTRRGTKTTYDEHARLLLCGNSPFKYIAYLFAE